MAAIDIFKRAGNEALEVNPPNPSIDIHLTNHGSDWLWAAFSVFALFAIAHAVIYGFVSSKSSALKKSLLVVPLFTNAVLAYTYFTYASNLGYTSTRTEFKHVSTDRDLYRRQIFYVKYIGYFLAWPFNLFAITVATSTLRDSSINSSTGENFTRLLSLISNLATKLLATEIFVLGLLIGGLIHSTYKWGYFTFAVTAQLFAITLISFNLSRSYRALSANKLANLLIVFQIIVWILYPIAWGLSEGGNKIQPDSEAVFYGILDLITFAFVPTILTWLNVKDVDEGFFHNWFRSGSLSEKHIGGSPRVSGDTAFSPAPAATDEPVAEPEATAPTNQQTESV